MTALSYEIVKASGAVMRGTDYTGEHDTAEQFAEWYRHRMPDAVEVRVWAGELADQPYLVEAVA